MNEAINDIYIEDIMPWISKIYQTQKWREYCRTVGDFLEYLGEHLREHKSTFDPSKYSGCSRIRN